ncbi:MAG: DUF5615 family PIN-like protein [Pirellulaceae bacterium]
MGERFNGGRLASYALVHGWSTNAADNVLMQWAVDHDSIVLTHDLDFGAMLVATQDAKPSVVQVRTKTYFLPISVTC